MKLENINDVIEEIFNIIYGFKITNKVIIENLLIERTDFQKLIGTLIGQHKLINKEGEIDFHNLWAILNSENNKKCCYTQIIYEGKTYFVQNDGVAIKQKLIKLSNKEDWDLSKMKVDYVNTNYVRFLENISFFISMNKIEILDWDWMKFKTPKELDIIYYSKKDKDLNKIKMIKISPEEQKYQTEKFGHLPGIDYITIFIDENRIFEYKEQDIDQSHTYVVSTDELFISKKTIEAIKGYFNE